MRNRIVGAVVVLSASVGNALAATCPSEPQVHAALTKYIETDYWSPSKRDVWKVKSISEFKFGPMRTGQIVKKQVEWGRAAQDVCPIRIEYSFTAERADGRREVTPMGVNKTHLFYQDPFQEWTFKVE